MKITLRSFLGFGLAAFFTIAAYAAGSSYSCSVRQGFNFEKDSQAQVGHINYLKIGDTAMNSDLAVTDPADVKKMVKVFGVLSGLNWKGGIADPVHLSAQVSTDNKNKLAALQHKSLANTEVEVQFTVYDYDYKAKKYFRCFHSNDIKLKGLVLKSGGELVMNIGMDQGQEVVSPKNHTFSLGVLPQDLAQEIRLAFSESSKLVKKWGISAGK